MVQVVPLISPTVWVQRYTNGVQQTGTTNYQTGIEQPKADPIESAKASKGKWANQVQMAINNDLYAKGLANVNMQDWNAAAKTLGVQRYQPGVTAKLPKYNAFVTAFSPLLSNLMSTVNAMPNTTSADRDAKSKAMADGLRALRGTW